MSIFIDRDQELSALEARYKAKKAEFIVVYGRRRVGKTELLKHFFADKPHVYYLCVKERDSVQLQKLSKRISEFLGETQPVIETWEDLFSYIAKKANGKRLVLVIDEFPYLVEKNKAIPSMFQLGWDEYLKDTDVFLMICGSSVSMMERLLGKKSPIYGRRTGQTEVLPMRVGDAFEFFPKYSLRQKIEAYAILGNIPQYLLEFNDKDDILTNVGSRFLDPGESLFKEPLFLLREELRDSGTYLTLLTYCTRPVRLNVLSSKTGIAMTKLPKYLNTLIDLRILSKHKRVTDKKPITKRSYYVLTDNMFKFWFEFVYPNVSEVEGGDKKKVLDKVKAGLDGYVGAAFEDICKQMLLLMKDIGAAPLEFSEVGRWWGHIREDGERREVEFDIVTLGPSAKDLGVFECKWQDLSRSKALDILSSVKENAALIEWDDKSRKEHFGLFARKIDGKDQIRQMGYLAYDLKDFEVLLRSNKRA